MVASMRWLASARTVAGGMHGALHPGRALAGGLCHQPATTLATTPGGRSNGKAPPRARVQALVNDTSTTRAALEQELPEGVTKDFLATHRTATASLLAAQGTSTVSMEEMVTTLRTPQDAELFLSLLERCRRAGVPPSSREPHVIMQGLLGKGEDALLPHLLRILSNRPLFGCVPKRELLHAIMARYYRQVLTLAADPAADVEGSPRMTEALDALSKCYLLLLYHDIPPTAESYAILIKAGVYSRSKEGWKRAVLTFKEQATLAIPMDATLPLAMAYGAVREGEWAEVLGYLERARALRPEGSRPSRQAGRLHLLALQGMGAPEAEMAQAWRVLRTLPVLRAPAALTTEEETFWHALWAARAPPSPAAVGASSSVDSPAADAASASA